ncbi:MAG: CoA pyrophosphatase [Fulvimonas sp.]|jgi:8-oxo-dGTP pyrophosphatase MutT (NUDIX family)|nr:CoA pyrophosphatase [Fulvimonas sp.]
MSADAFDTIARALLPLAEPPEGMAWNQDDMRAWIGDGPRRPAAVLVGLREGSQPRFLLTRRNDRLSAHAGQVAFPGGRRDPQDADPVATALRESQEEIGLDPAKVTPLGYLEAFDTISGYRITPVVARVAAHAVLRPAPDEVAAVFEVPLAFVLDPANLRRYTMEFAGRHRPMVEFQHEGYRIWGATAAILHNLLTRMGHA